MEELVSVIIPVYKTESYIAKCLDSVISQDYQMLEIIVVDDGSPDDSYKIVEKYQICDTRIKLLRQKNSGLSAARNTGIVNAKGDFILFLDSDDSLVEGAVTKLVEHIKHEDADLVIVQSYYQLTEKTGKMCKRYLFSDDMYEASPIDFALKVLIERGRAWRATALLYSADVIKNNNILFPEGHTSEDVVFNLAILSHAKKIAFYSEPTLYCLKRQGSITSTFNADFYKSLQYIDGVVLNFLKDTNSDNKSGMTKRNSLLARNIVIYIISAMDAKNGWDFKAKRCFAEKILIENQTVFDSELALPCFDSKIKTIFMRIIYWMLKRKMYLGTEIFIVVSGRLRRIA